MFILRFILVVLFFSISLFASIVKIDKTTNGIEILPQSYIYIDDTKQLTIEEVKKKEFKVNKENILSYGYAPPFAVWIKFTLHNTTTKSIEKILQYDHKITANIKFYDGNKVYNEGLNNLPKARDTLNPIFQIKLQPQEIKTYYIRTSSYITPLTVKLNIWNIKDIYVTNINQQFMLALFFGGMGILALYNLFIFFSTREISYFWYVFYILGAVWHHLFYSGLIYRLEPEPILEFFSTRGAYITVTFQFIAIILFTKYFLNIKKYSKINKILNFYVISIPVFVAIGVYREYTSGWQNLFYISSIIFLFIVACYLSVKKNRQAYFVVGGWLVLFTTWMIMYSINIGLLSESLYIYHFVEIGILGEAVVFSFALADRIKIANKEKELANEKLIEQQQSEEKRLKIEVENKTKNLTKALGEKDLLLDEKELLFKELHHRVKNNMQMVVSMIRLQSKRVDDEKLKTIFQTAQNRINTMAHLHELLYKQENITHIDTLEYFTLIIDELQETTSKDITINYDIQTNLKMEQAIYCGLILNELISNAFKYAFVEKGMIDISLSKDKNSFILIVQDDGKGFDKTAQTDSLGLILVNTLATRQLKGTINFQSNKGTSVKIIWKNNE
ncbi:7TM diverse intracellular signaling domain-containing protein [Halarcobacter sp.]|uniref:7TM diverse intracellular signaling domain-containing protein n=1 Tax=Halarcobacter sp. TaxID=2321133 RepID=UPI002AAC1FBA|nr:7TM diverse intracellular signaling domain-containing protein [Halarcobacter sp.]